MKIISICAKTSDMFSAVLKQDERILGHYDGYVPPLFTKDGDEDYVMLDIDVENGRIVNWLKPSDKQLKAIFNHAKTRQT